MQKAIFDNRIINFGFLKILLKKSKKIIPLKKEPQLNADLIIDRLNLALSFDSKVKIQFNVEEDSDRVANLEGKLLQSSKGYLFLQNKNDLKKIDPAKIRFIHLID
ncbi:hypothetical protein ACKP2L_03395 [Oenococcus alcoholitolerans]|uniref:hypothetical protein n=1 Tax=Oenococcus alcoholitolerans TaxID=931074 RepID=UPI003F710FD7